MQIRELIAKVRDKLQDTDAVYWSDSELVDLCNECKRYLAAERKENPTTFELVTYDGIESYTMDGILRYISAKNSDGNELTLYPDDGSSDGKSSGVIIEDYNKVKVINAEDEVITVKAISFPEEDNLNDTIRMGDEESYRYFVLSKCYEKDNDMEQFQKAQYFWSMFMGAMKYSKKNSSLGYVEKVHTTKSYFY